MRLTVSHTFLPKHPTAHTSLIMDHYGIAFETGRHVIADNLDLPIEPGQIVAFTGPSGSGKSSLLRATATHLPHVLDIDALDLPQRPLIDILTSPTLSSTACGLAQSLPHTQSLQQALHLLTSCGLGEPRLLLRTPQELSDGQRYRFRLAYALAHRPHWILADEFTATLDRTLAKIIAHNLHRQNTRTHIGFLLATTHEDILEDLAPQLHIGCALDTQIHVRPRPPSPAPPRKPLSLARHLFFTRGTKSDWHYFARWHYRSHNLGIVRHVTLLWYAPPAKGTGSERPPALDNSAMPSLGACPRRARENQSSTKESPDDPARSATSASPFPVLAPADLPPTAQPIGICVFTSAPLALSQRNRAFGLKGRWSRTSIRAVDKQLVMLSRVVLHPTWRGAGIAAPFIRQSCRSAPWPFIETLTQLGHILPVFEAAGFQRIGTTQTAPRDRRSHSALYGTKSRHARKPIVTQETHQKSAHAHPIYYLFDNRSPHFQPASPVPSAPNS